MNDALARWLVVITYVGVFGLGFVRRQLRGRLDMVLALVVFLAGLSVLFLRS